MIGRLKFVGLGVLVALLCGAVTAGAASAAKKPKPELILKVADEGKEGGATIASGSKVPAGWFVQMPGMEAKHVFCEVLPEEGEEEGSMVLNTNSSTKADKATGTVAPPPCWEETGPEEVSKATDVTLSGGPLKSQEMTTKNKGAMDLSAGLLVTLETAGKKCAYEDTSKTIKGEWPPVYAEEEPEKKEEEEAFPFLEDTANLVAEPKFKLDKKLTTATGCAKTEEAFVESWLGPLGEEFEAELT